MNKSIEETTDYLIKVLEELGKREEEMKRKLDLYIDILEKGEKLKEIKLICQNMEKSIDELSSITRQ